MRETGERAEKKKPSLVRHERETLRKRERLVVHLTGLLDGEKVQGQGILLNLSPTGCAMRSDRNFQVGDQVSLRIFFPENPVPFTITNAEVRWISKGKCGLAFMNLESDYQQQLRQLLQEYHLFST